MAANFHSTTLQSAAYQPLRRGHSGAAVERAIKELQLLVEVLGAGRHGPVGVAGAAGVGADAPEWLGGGGEPGRGGGRAWLQQIAKAAYDKQLRSLRC